MSNELQPQPFHIRKNPFKYKCHFQARILNTYHPFPLICGQKLGLNFPNHIKWKVPLACRCHSQRLIAISGVMILHTSLNCSLQQNNLNRSFVAQSSLLLNLPIIGDRSECINGLLMNVLLMPALIIACLRWIQIPIDTTLKTEIV